MWYSKWSSRTTCIADHLQYGSTQQPTCSNLEIKLRQRTIIMTACQCMLGRVLLLSQDLDIELEVTCNIVHKLLQLGFSADNS